MPWVRPAALTVAAALTVTGCTGADSASNPDDDLQADAGAGDDSSGGADGAPDDSAPESDAAPAPRDCTTDGPADLVTDLTGTDAATVADAVAITTHTCSDVVVVAAADVAWAAPLAAPLAATAGAPLLLASAANPDVPTDLIAELAPRQVVTVGFPGDLDLEVGTATQLRPVAAEPQDDRTALALGVAEDLGADIALGFVSHDAGSLAVALSRAADGLPLLPLPADDGELQQLVTQLPPRLRVQTIARDAAGAEELAARLLDLGIDAEPSSRPRFATDRSEVAWLADPADTAGYAVAAAAAGGRGEVLLPVVGDAPWRVAERTSRLREVAPDRTALVGAADAEAAAWQLPIVLDSEPLPTGGYTLFASERIVAMYGTPGSSSLGVLGEQDLDATVARLREIAAPYDADGRTVLPAFEIITTVASSDAGAQGDYSRRVDPATLRPWIERAAEEDFYVVLDLQPGRTDFLTQAQEYEEFLREPHVGLALDPEWRLEDDEVHLRQIGSVEAEEVQRVADWLAELVREHRLPQKLFLLHQFRLSMLPDRDTVEVGSELAGLVHMDGQGAIGTKYGTYDTITAGAEDRWWWGWKNFYDEDFPTPIPEEVLALDPRPVYVSYQ